MVAKWLRRSTCNGKVAGSSSICGRYFLGMGVSSPSANDGDITVTTGQSES